MDWIYNNIVDSFFKEIEMKHNYHTHTPRCKHASGSEEEYIKIAIDAGFETFGFSDHAPFFFLGDYVSPSRMEMSEIDDYFDTLLSLREKYKYYIDVKIGFEIEYYPRLWDRAIEKFRNYPLDYLILGEHLIGNESISAINAFTPTNDENVLKTFVDHCVNAINTDRITYICHPDNINFTGDDDVYVKEMSRLIIACNQKNIPLEMNLYGIRDGRHYPKKLFWETAASLGARAVLGQDCHKISHVCVKEEIEQATRLTDSLGIELCDGIPLKSPIF